MQLHLFNSPDGQMLWGAFLKGRHNDGDGGIDIFEEWYMVARTEQEVRRALAAEIQGRANQFSWYPGTHSIVYRPVGLSELVVCSRRPGGRLHPVALGSRSAVGFSLTAALMDTRE